MHKIITDLNCDGFSVNEFGGSNPADNYIKLIVCPLRDQNSNIDWKLFENLVGETFFKAKRFEAPLIGGDFCQIHSSLNFLPLGPSTISSSDHRVWRLWKNGALGYCANLNPNPNAEVPIGHLILHYLNFCRLTARRLGSYEDISFEAELQCRSIRFNSTKPYFGISFDHDATIGIQFSEMDQDTKDGNPYSKVLTVGELNTADKLAGIILDQVQETNPTASINPVNWRDMVQDLFHVDPGTARINL